MNKSNDSDYQWSFGEVRKLDNALSELKDEVKLLRIEVKNLKNEMKVPMIVDNRDKTDWKALGIIIGATLAGVIAIVEQYAKSK
jgi:hypothetical protein